MWSAMTLSDSVSEVARAGDPAAAAMIVAKQVDVVVGVHALHHRGDALQTHAGIDRRLGQRRQRAPSSRSYCMNTRFQISM